MFNTENYADTLFSQFVLLQGNQFSIDGLEPAGVDIIIDREGFFPVKYVGVGLQSGKNSIDEQVLMYRSSTPLAIPGELEVTLKEGVALETIKPIYSGFDEIKVSRVPGAYELKLPFRGTKLTRERVERLCRNLVRSQHVADARPLANLTTIIPGL